MSIQQNLVDITILKLNLEDVIQEAIRETVDTAYAWVETYFPRDTGKLIESTIITINQTADNQFTVEINISVDYAKYVNEMVGVNWTNPLTVEGFIDVLRAYIINWLRDNISRGIRSISNLFQVAGLRVE